MSIFTAAKAILSLICGFLTRTLRDFHVYGGLILVGFGLWRLQPWLSLTVCGAILILLGLGWLTRRAKP
jgi:hypothetical protein